MTSYAEFLAARTQLEAGTGFEPVWEPGFLYPFQRALVDWAVRQGRAALRAELVQVAAVAVAWIEGMNDTTPNQDRRPP